MHWFIISKHLVHSIITFQRQNNKDEAGVTEHEAVYQKTSPHFTSLHQKGTYTLQPLSMLMALIIDQRQNTPPLRFIM